MLNNWSSIMYVSMLCVPGVYMLSVIEQTVFSTFKWNLTTYIVYSTQRCAVTV